MGTDIVEIDVRKPDLQDVFKKILREEGQRTCRSKRVKAILLEEFPITRSSMEVIVDLFFLSIMSVVVFGFFSLFLSSRLDGPAAHYLLLGMLLWEVVRVTQYSISLGAMWEVWSRNLTNLFVTPLHLQEYLAAAVISGALKSLLILSVVTLISFALFDFSVTGWASWNPRSRSSTSPCSRSRSA